MEPTPQSPANQPNEAAQNVPVTIKPDAAAASPTAVTPVTPATPVAPISPVASAMPSTAPIIGTAPAITPEVTQSAPAPVVTAPATPIIGSVAPISGGSLPPQTDGTNKRKLLIFAGAGLAGLTAIFIGAYFMLYLPTTPSRLYATGLDRTGEAFTTFVEEATEEKQLKAITSSEVTGNYTSTIDGKKVSGTVGSKFDSKSSDSSIDFKSDATAVNAQIMTNIADSAKFPDIYFKVKGLESTGITAMLPGLAAFEDKWISVSASYIESLAADTRYGEDYNGVEFKAEDAAEIAKIATQKTSEYVFTSDPKKAIFDEQQYIDSPMIDGSKMHRYSVQLNKTNLEAYCVDLTTSVIGSKAYKNLTGDQTDTEIAEQKETAKKDCKIDDDSVNDSKYELWISTKTKLLHKIRATDAKDSGNYIEIGQNYTGGDTFPLFVNFHSDKDKQDVSVTLLTNLEKSITTLKFSGKSGTDTTYSGNLTFKPFDGNVNTTPPAGAVPIEQLLNALGFSSGDDEIGSISPANGRTVTTSSNRNTSTAAPKSLSDFFQNLNF